MKKKFNILLIIGTIIFSTACENEEKINEPSNVIEIGEEDGSFQISKITHGDTPVYLIEDDLFRLEAIYASIESLDIDPILFKGKRLLDLNIGELISTYDLVIDKVEKDERRLRGEGIWVYLKEDEIIGYKFDSPAEFIRENSDIFPTEELTIADFKRHFPNSYKMRNILDSYLLNFSAEDSAIVYDYAYLNVINRKEQLHLRWIDGEIIEITLN